MNYFKISILGIVLFFASCDDAVDDAACVDISATVLEASAAYGTDMSYSNCQALKTAALDFASNSCDTAGVGDLSFVIDSLDCNQMACALPLANLIAYGLSMQMATDSATYCMLFDSTMMAVDTLLKYNCWGEDSTSYYTTYYDSVKAAGCDPTAEVTLFSATFHEEYDPTVKSFVYISDSLGSVIADTSFYGSGSFVFNKKYTLGTAPEKIGVTTVTYYSEWDEYSLTTNLGIDIGSDFHYYDPYSEEPTETIGESHYIFNNVEDWTGEAVLRISTKGSSSGGVSCCEWIESTETSQGSGYVRHYYDNEDVLILFHREDGTAGYLNIENVSIGDTTVVDLSALETAQIVQIPNNTGDPYAYHSYYGYGESGSFNWFNRLARLKSSTELDYSNDNFVVKYPQSIISRFRITAVVVGNYNAPDETQYAQVTAGDLPSSIEKIDAAFDVISSDLGNFEISHSGSFDQWAVSLRDTSISAYWTVYNSPSTSTMILPSIPTSVSDEYSVLSSSTFSYYRIRLTDWMCAETYKEWIELFHSSDGYYLDFCSGLRDLTYWLPE